MGDTATMSGSRPQKPSVVCSLHQLDGQDSDKDFAKVASIVGGERKLPKISYLKHEAAAVFKRVRSFGSFQDLVVPDIDGYESSENTEDDDDDDDDSWGLSGYVTDASEFDRILISAWEDRFAGGLFRYDVTAVSTKVIVGNKQYVAQFNIGRATNKRPTEFSIDKVCQDFDANKFNFTKADLKEVLFSFTALAGQADENVNRSIFEPSACVGESPTVVLINVSPIEYGHVLLCPRVTDKLPQQITPDVLLPALYMASESRNPYFRVGYNSLGAYATINHLHFQAYYLMEAFPIERAPTVEIAPGTHGACTVYRVNGYPVRCLCFEVGDSFEELATLVGDCCVKLQGANIPFNILIADHGARVFLIPQVFSRRIAHNKIPESVIATGVNPAVFEISGHLLYKQESDYDGCTESSAEELLACASLTETQFLALIKFTVGEGKNSPSAVQDLTAVVDSEN
jgi:GDP-L-galactose phosphorylase